MYTSHAGFPTCLVTGQYLFGVAELPHYKVGIYARREFFPALLRCCRRGHHSAASSATEFCRGEAGIECLLFFSNAVENFLPSTEPLLEQLLDLLPRRRSIVRDVLSDVGRAASLLEGHDVLERDEQDSQESQSGDARPSASTTSLHPRFFLELLDSSDACASSSDALLEPIEAFLIDDVPALLKALEAVLDYALLSDREALLSEDESTGEFFAQPSNKEEKVEKANRAEGSEAGTAGSGRTRLLSTLLDWIKKMQGCDESDATTSNCGESGTRKEVWKAWASFPGLAVSIGPAARYATAGACGGSSVVINDMVRVVSAPQPQDPHSSQYKEMISPSLAAYFRRVFLRQRFLSMSPLALSCAEELDAEIYASGGKSPDQERSPQQELSREGSSKHATPPAVTGSGDGSRIVSSPTSTGMEDSPEDEKYARARQQSREVDPRAGRGAEGDKQATDDADEDDFPSSFADLITTGGLETLAATSSASSSARTSACVQGHTPRSAGASTPTAAQQAGPRAARKILHQGRLRMHTLRKYRSWRHPIHGEHRVERHFVLSELLPRGHPHHQHHQSRTAAAKSVPQLQLEVFSINFPDRSKGCHRILPKPELGVYHCNGACRFQLRLENEELLKFEADTAAQAAAWVEKLREATAEVLRWKNMNAGGGNRDGMAQTAGCTAVGAGGGLLLGARDGDGTYGATPGGRGGAVPGSAFDAGMSMAMAETGFNTWGARARRAQSAEHLRFRSLTDLVLESFTYIRRKEGQKLSARGTTSSDSSQHGIKCQTDEGSSPRAAEDPIDAFFWEQYVQRTLYERLFWRELRTRVTTELLTAVWVVVILLFEYVVNRFVFRFLWKRCFSRLYKRLGDVLQRRFFSSPVEIPLLTPDGDALYVTYHPARRYQNRGQHVSLFSFHEEGDSPSEGAPVGARRNAAEAGQAGAGVGGGGGGEGRGKGSRAAEKANSGGVGTKSPRGLNSSASTTTSSREELSSLVEHESDSGASTRVDLPLVESRQTSRRSSREDLLGMASSPPSASPSPRQYSEASASPRSSFFGTSGGHRTRADPIAGLYRFAAEEGAEALLELLRLSSTSTSTPQSHARGSGIIGYACKYDFATLEVADACRPGGNRDGGKDVTTMSWFLHHGRQQEKETRHTCSSLERTKKQESDDVDSGVTKFSIKVGLGPDKAFFETHDLLSLCPDTQRETTAQEQRESSCGKANANPKSPKKKCMCLTFVQATEGDFVARHVFTRQRELLQQEITLYEKTRLSQGEELGRMFRYWEEILFCDEEDDD